MVGAIVPPHIASRVVNKHDRFMVPHLSAECGASVIYHIHTTPPLVVKNRYSVVVYIFLVRHIVCSVLCNRQRKGLLPFLPP